MGDLITWAVLTVLSLYAAVRSPKEARYLRLLWLWFAASMAVLELLDLRGGHPAWLKWPFFAVMLALGTASCARNEAGQRTYYALMWSTLRSGIAERNPFRRS